VAARFQVLPNWLAKLRRPLPCRLLDHDRRNAQANGGSRRECEERDPHGVIPSFYVLFDVALIVLGVRS